MKLPKLFRRKRAPAPLTLDEALAQGLVLPPRYVPKSGVSVKYYKTVRDQQGRISYEPEVQIFYPSWADWRFDRMSRYFGGPGIFEYRDVPSGIREPIIDLSAGHTDLEYEAARGFLMDHGIAKGPPDKEVKHRGRVH